MGVNVKVRREAPANSELRSQELPKWSPSLPKWFSNIFESFENFDFFRVLMIFSKSFRIPYTKSDEKKLEVGKKKTSETLFCIIWEVLFFLFFFDLILILYVSELPWRKAIT